MSPVALGKIVDVGAMGDMPTGVMSVDVPPGWLTSGGTYWLQLPRRIACLKCGGGGCGDCDLSGAFFMHSESVEIKFRVSPGASTGCHVRLRPPASNVPGTFAIALVVNMRQATTVSDCIRRAEEDL